ncbi:MAG: hypothetical protein LDLANPLL_02659 [Turneriella sp.]|nr:hypothetical protein [Turneriella sp.]
MRTFGEKIRIYIITVFVAFYAATSSASISLQQIFYALALLSWLLSFFLLRKSGSALPAFKWRTYYWLPVLWVVWRLFHIAISEFPLKELTQAREVWLILMLPLTADIVAALRVLPQDKKSIQLLGLSPLYFVLLFLVISGALIGLFNVIEVVKSGGFTNFRAAGLNNNNALTYSGASALTWMLALGFLLVVRKWQTRPRFLLPLLWVCFILMALAFILAKSRGGFVALILMAGFMSLVILRKKAILAWGAILALSLGAWFSSSSLRNLFYAAMPKEGSHSGTMEQRLDMWRAGIKMIQAKPIVGFGDAGYTAHYHEYKVEGAVDVAAAASHLHNDFLNTWALYGAVGFTLFMLFFLWPLYDFVRIDTQTRSHPYWPLMAASLAGVYFMFFNGLSQCHFTDEEVQTLLWLTIGVFYGTRDQILVSSFNAQV